MPRLSVIALCGAAWCLAATAHAQTQPSNPPLMRFGWVRAQGAERCPTSTTIAHAVEARIGRTVFSQDAPQSVEAIIQRTDPAVVGPAAPRWAVSIFLRDVDGTLLGTRTLSSDRPDCEGAAASAIFAIALAIDPESALRPEHTQESTPTQSTPVAESDAVTRATLAAIAHFTELAVRPQPTPAAVVRPVVTPITPVRPPIAHTTLGSVALGVWVPWGLLPQLGAGPVLNAYARLYRRLGLRGAMHWLPEQRTDTQQSVDVSFGLLGAQLAVDVELLSSERAMLSLYAGPSLNVIHAVVHGRIPADTGERFALGVSLGAAGSMQLAGPLELTGGVDLTVPVVRYRYRLEGPIPATLYEQPWLSAGAWLAIGARFQ